MIITFQFNLIAYRRPDQVSAENFYFETSVWIGLGLSRLSGQHACMVGELWDKSFEESTCRPAVGCDAQQLPPMHVGTPNHGNTQRIKINHVNTAKTIVINV
jgi:hypothetical protein